MKNTDRYSTRPFLDSFLLPEKESLGLILMFGVFSAMLMLIFPVGVQALVNSIAFTGLAQPLIILTIIVFILLASATVLQLIQVYLMERVQRRLYVRSVEGFRGFLQENKGSFLKGSRFAEISVVQKNFTHLWIEGMALVFRLLVGFSLLFLYHSTLAIFGFLMVAGITLTVLWGARKGSQLAIEESNAKYLLIDHTLSGQNKEKESDHFINEDEEIYLKARTAHFGLLFRQTILIYIIALLAGTIILAAGGSLVLNGHLSIGQLVAAELIIGMISFSLFKFPKHLETYYDLVASLSKLKQVYNTHPAFERNTRNVLRHFKLRHPRLGRVFARFALVTTGIILLVLALPWRQTSIGQGKVIAYAPDERPQTLEATVDGRIKSWHVREGDWVNKGKLLVELEDTDPNAINRLELEREAVLRQLESISTARNLINKNFQRQRQLLKEGVVSKQEVEAAEVKLSETTEKEGEVFAKLAQLDTKISRQHAQKIIAPVSGYVSRIFNGPGGEILKKGDPLLVLVPQANSRIMEAWIDGNDVPLIEAGLKTRIQFEGWPAFIFSGWPGLTIGTFEGRVKSIDLNDEFGKFRVLIEEPTPDSWPQTSILRQGTRAIAWVLLQEVNVGYELWRKMNGFPVVRNPESLVVNKDKKIHSKSEREPSSTMRSGIVNDGP